MVVEERNKQLAAKRQMTAFENYTLQEGDTKTYVTTSVAYLAQHANIPCKHEPWLHLRRCQRLVLRGREIVSNEVGYVVYIWDTREVVQWIEAKQGESLRLDTPKAVDNAKPLKDVKHLLPDWVTEDVKSSRNLWSMANMPKDVQDRRYNKYLPGRPANESCSVANESQNYAGQYVIVYGIKHPGIAVHKGFATKRDAQAYIDSQKAKYTDANGKFTYTKSMPGYIEFSSRTKIMLYEKLLELQQSKKSKK